MEGCPFSRESIFHCCYREPKLQRCIHARSFTFCHVTVWPKQSELCGAPWCIGPLFFCHEAPPPLAIAPRPISRWQPLPPHYSLEEGEKRPTLNPSMKFTHHFYSYQIGKNLVALLHLAARKPTSSCKVGQILRNSLDEEVCKNQDSWVALLKAPKFVYYFLNVVYSASYTLLGRLYHCGSPESLRTVSSVLSPFGQVLLGPSPFPARHTLQKLWLSGTALLMPCWEPLNIPLNWTYGKS